MIFFTQFSLSLKCSIFQEEKKKIAKELEEEELEPMVENPELIKKEMEALYGTDKATEILGCKILDLRIVYPHIFDRGLVLLWS